MLNCEAVNSKGVVMVPEVAMTRLRKFHDAEIAKANFCELLREGSQLETMENFQSCWCGIGHSRNSQEALREFANSIMNLLANTRNA